jgi:hypothetical protein
MQNPLCSVLVLSSIVQDNLGMDAPVFRGRMRTLDFEEVVH